MTTTPAVEIDLDKQRAEFEAWATSGASSIPAPPDLSRLAEGYARLTIEIAWRAWQAQARASQAVAEPVATVEEGKFANRLQWVSDEAMASVPVGSKLYAAPVAQQSEAGRPGNFGEEVTRLVNEIRKPISMAWRDSLVEQLIELIDPSPEGVKAVQPIEAGAPTAAATFSEQLDKIENAAWRMFQYGRIADDAAGREEVHKLRVSLAAPTSGRESAAPLAKQDAKDAGALGMALVVNKKLGDVLLGRSYLLPDDLAALRRFEECASDFDSGGHDVSKPAMARLREIGVVQAIGFGRHQTTAFGDYVLERTAGEPVSLPLMTLAERNAAMQKGAQQ